MRRPWPRTMKSRATLVLVFAFMLSHGISLAIYEANRDRTILLTEATDLANRIAGVVNLADVFPRDDRRQILAAAETQFLTMFPAPEDLSDEKCQANEFSTRLSESLRQALAGINDVRAEVCMRRVKPALLLGSRKPLHGYDVLVTVSFPDNENAVFHAVLPEGESLIDDAVLLYLLSAILIALLLAWHLIRRTVAPLTALARAAESIGTNIDAAPLAEAGPQEVRSATRAFNDMQQRIQRLVHGQTELLGAMSHDLRSATTRLQLRTELLAEPREREGLIRVVTDMKQIVQSTIDFVRGVEPTESARRVDIAALVDSLCDDLAEEGYPISCTVPTHPFPMVCRPAALRRALQNLIENAIKYGGEARVSTQSTDKATLRIAVEDDGPGISNEELSAVLRPFYRLEKSRNSETGGVGLGLSIAQNIAQAHGGQLRLSNLPGGGLRAELCLPVS